MCPIGLVGTSASERSSLIVITVSRPFCMVSRLICRVDSLSEEPGHSVVIKKVFRVSTRKT